MQPPSAERVWTAAQQLLRTIVNPDIYNLWFAPLRATALAEEAITLEVANDFQAACSSTLGFNGVRYRASDHFKEWFATDRYVRLLHVYSQRTRQRPDT